MDNTWWIQGYIEDRVWYYYCQPSISVLQELQACNIDLEVDKNNIIILCDQAYENRPCERKKSPIFSVFAVS